MPTPREALFTGAGHALAAPAPDQEAAPAPAPAPAPAAPTTAPINPLVAQRAEAREMAVRMQSVKDQVAKNQQKAARAAAKAAGAANDKIKPTEEGFGQLFEAAAQKVISYDWVVSLFQQSMADAL